MIKSRQFKGILYFISLIIFTKVALAASMTVQQLADSYDYSFYNGTINVTSQNDYMFDQNSNGVNDTLVINLTANSASGTYTFIIEIYDTNGILINSTAKTLTASDSSANVNFPSELLSKGKFNYSILINDNDGNLVFRKLGSESQAYSNYDNGINITKITDESVNNNFILINSTVSSPNSKVVNVTVNLAYNSSLASMTEEKQLNAGSQVISVKFDNETIKGTHFVGNLTIDRIIIGNKIFYPKRNTSVYNYEDFADTSYIKSIIDGRIDTNGNNLSEFLEINFTAVSKTADNYTLSYDLYDQFNNYVTSFNKTQFLNISNQTLQTLINGSNIYKSKINGPYVISFVKLAIGNETKDIIFDAYTTNQSFYTDYEMPPLPDLKVQLSTIFNQTSNVTYATANLSNIGTAPAFNVFLDIFDNITYNNNASLAFLSNGDKVTYQFNITNSFNASLVTAIADFDNLVDEINESNNIAQNTVQNIPVLNQTAPTQVIDVHNFSLLYDNSTLKIFEFSINNTGTTALPNTNWTLNTGLDIIRSNSFITLQPINRTFVFVNYNYTQTGTFTANATAINGTNQDSETLLVSILSALGIDVNNLAILNQSLTRRIFEFRISNLLGAALTNISWIFDTKNSNIINSTSTATIQPNNLTFVFIDYNFTTTGTYNVNATGKNNTLIDSENLTITVS